MKTIGSDDLILREETEVIIPAGRVTEVEETYFRDKDWSQADIYLTEEELHYETEEEGVCIHEVIYDENEKAVDYKIIDLNPRYEDILGIKRTDAVDS